MWVAVLTRRAPQGVFANGGAGCATTFFVDAAPTINGKPVSAEGASLLPGYGGEVKLNMLLSVDANGKACCAKTVLKCAAGISLASATSTARHPRGPDHRPAVRSPRVPGHRRDRLTLRARQRRAVIHECVTRRRAEAILTSAPRSFCRRGVSCRTRVSSDVHVVRRQQLSQTSWRQALLRTLPSAVDILLCRYAVFMLDVNSVK